jgi:ribosomal protein S2
MIEFTIDQLLNFNIYLGYTKAIDSMFVYLRGKRLNFYIINLYLTIFFFKRFLSYLSLFLEKKGLF